MVQDPPLTYKIFEVDYHRSGVAEMQTVRVLAYTHEDARNKVAQDKRFGRVIRTRYLREA